MPVVDSEFQKLDGIFSVGILQTLVKLVQVEILELITCSATGTVYAGEDCTDIK